MKRLLAIGFGIGLGLPIGVLVLIEGFNKLCNLKG